MFSGYLRSQYQSWICEDLSEWVWVLFIVPKRLETLLHSLSESFSPNHLQSDHSLQDRDGWEQRKQSAEPVSRIQYGEILIQPHNVRRARELGWANAGSGLSSQLYQSFTSGQRCSEAGEIRAVGAYLSTHLATVMCPPGPKGVSGNHGSRLRSDSRG